MSPRKYDTRRRQQAVDANRTAILEAARSILGGKGDLTDFSMEQVAEKAGVSRMTIYYQFRSRAGLLDALADHLAERAEMFRVRELFHEPDPERAVRRLVDTFVGLWATDRVTMRRLRALGVVFPSDAAAPRNRDAWRRDAVAHVLARFGRGEPPGDLVDLFASLTSFETFDSLSTGSRTPDAVSALLSAAALELLRARRFGPRPER
jgi:AcrR family transcriptional regulator